MSPRGIVCAKCYSVRRLCFHPCAMVDWERRFGGDLLHGSPYEATMSFAIAFLHRAESLPLERR